MFIFDTPRNELRCAIWAYVGIYRIDSQTVGIHRCAFDGRWIRCLGQSLTSNCERFQKLWQEVEERLALTPEKIKEMDYWDAFYLEESRYRPGNSGYLECKERFESNKMGRMNKSTE